jgi:PD-(D/E)XK nuclease superfamily
MTENEVAKQIVDAAYRMHTSLGPGLLESAYEAVLGIRVGKARLAQVTAAGCSHTLSKRPDRDGIPGGPDCGRQRNRGDQVGRGRCARAQETAIDASAVGGQAIGLAYQFQCRVPQGWHYAHHQRHVGLISRKAARAPRCLPSSGMICENLHTHRQRRSLARWCQSVCGEAALCS